MGTELPGYEERSRPLLQVPSGHREGQVALRPKEEVTAILKAQDRSKDFFFKTAAKIFFRRKEYKNFILLPKQPPAQTPLQQRSTHLRYG